MRNFTALFSLVLVASFFLPNTAEARRGRGFWYPGKRIIQRMRMRRGGGCQGGGCRVNQGCGPQGCGVNRGCGPQGCGVGNQGVGNQIIDNQGNQVIDNEVGPGGADLAPAAPFAQITPVANNGGNPPVIDFRKKKPTAPGSDNHNGNSKPGWSPSLNGGSPAASEPAAKPRTLAPPPEQQVKKAQGLNIKYLGVDENNKSLKGSTNSATMRKDYEDALKAAKDSGKDIVFVKFTAEWCPGCKVAANGLKELKAKANNGLENATILEVNHDLKGDKFPSYDYASIPAMFAVIRDTKGEWKVSGTFTGETTIKVGKSGTISPELVEWMKSFAIEGAKTNQ